MTVLEWENVWGKLRCNNPDQNEVHINLSSNRCCQLAASEMYIVMEEKIKYLEAENSELRKQNRRLEKSFKFFKKQNQRIKRWKNRPINEVEVEK